MYEKRVLIETYWNVNQRIVFTTATTPQVLIETYWNVNILIAVKKVTPFTRINRNILECK